MKLRFFLINCEFFAKKTQLFFAIIVTCLLNSHLINAQDWPIDKLINGEELQYNSSPGFRYGLEVEVAPRYLRLRVHEFDFEPLQKMKENGDLFQIKNESVELATYHSIHLKRIFTNGRSDDADLNRMYISEKNRWETVLVDYTTSEAALNSLPANIKSYLTSGLNLNSKLQLESPDRQIIIPDTNTVLDINKQQIPESIQQQAFEGETISDARIAESEGSKNTDSSSIYIPDREVYSPQNENGPKADLNIKTSNYNGLEVPHTYLNSKDWLTLKNRWNSLPLSTKIQAINIQHLTPLKKSILYTLYPEYIQIQKNNPNYYIFKNLSTVREANHVVEYKYNYDYIMNNSERYLEDLYNITDFFKITKKINNPLTESQEGFSYHLNFSDPTLKELKNWQADDFILNLNILHLLQAHSLDLLHFNSLLDYDNKNAHVQFVVMPFLKGDPGEGFGLVTKRKGPIFMRPNKSRIEIRSHILPPQQELEFYKYYFSKPVFIAKAEIDHEIINRISIDIFRKLEKKAPFISAAITGLLIDNLNYILKNERSKKIKETFDHAIFWLNSFLSERISQKIQALTNASYKESEDIEPLTKAIESLQNETLKRISHLDEKALLSLYYMIKNNPHFNKVQFEDFWFRFLLSSPSYYVRGRKNPKVSLAKQRILKLLIKDNINPFDMLRLIENDSLVGWNITFKNLVVEFPELKLDYITDPKFETPTLQHLNGYQKSILSSLLMTSLKETHRAIKNGSSTQILDAGKFLQKYKSGSILAKSVKFEQLYLEKWSDYIQTNASYDFQKDLYNYIINKRTNAEDLNEAELNFLHFYIKKRHTDHNCLNYLTKDEEK